MTQDDFQAQLDILVTLRASLDGLKTELETKRHDDYKLNRLALPLGIPLQPMTLTGSSPNLTGTLDIPEMFGPRASWGWQLDGMGAQGFTTGSVSVYLNSTNAEEIFSFSSAGVFYQRKFRFLNQSQRLVFSATGITGTVAVWLSGVQFHDSVSGRIVI